MSRGTVAEIDLSALQHNFSVVEKLITREKITSNSSPRQILAVVKSNAYGHGAEQVVHSLPTADGFGVAFIEEALPLRKLTQQPLLLLEGVFTVAELALAAQQKLDVVIHSLWQAEMLESASLKSPINIWLKVNTGMNRLGLSATDILELYQRLKAHKQIRRIRLMSHFACADVPQNSFNQCQLQQFKQISQSLNEPIETSMANSAALITQADALLDWVRPGIMLYGGSPVQNQTAEQLNLRPVMTLRSRIIATQLVKAGESVGYGQQWVAARDSEIGIVAVGYGDGYPRVLPSGTAVLVDGQRASLIGRVSMDMIAVDLGAVRGAKVGSGVTLWGKGLPADEIAAAAKTISYELFCQLSSRVERVVLSA